MTFEQLEFLIAAAEHKTFLDAAETLHISQSSLSKQLQKLEQELDIPLFDRSQRKSCLTEAGTYFYREALRLHKDYRQVLAGLAAYRKGDSHRLRIGTLPILAQYGLSGSLKEFSASCPDISIEIEEAEETELLDGLEREHYDLVLARENLFTPSLHQTSPIAGDELVAAVPASHPLALHPSIHLEELADEPLILMKPYTCVYQTCMAALKKTGVPVRLLRTSRIESMLSSVAVSEGIGLLAQRNFEVFRHANVVPIPLDPPVLLPVAAGWKRGKQTKRTLMKLLAFLHETAAGAGK